MLGAEPFVSTGRLPEDTSVGRAVDKAYELFRSNGEGAVSNVYPALAVVPHDLFGICVAGTNGAVHARGDAEEALSIMSVSKPFVFALVCQELGAHAVREMIGVNGTGLPFNSLAAVERAADGRTNPMVNAGAIATTSLCPGANLDEKWRFVRDGLSRFAARELSLNEDVFRSASETNHRSEALAHLLFDVGRLYCAPAEAAHLYTMQCALNVSATDLAVMGATLADGGVNPLSGERVVDPSVCHATLAVMATAGMYETSGDWLYEVGLPGKSGIGGGIVAVAPGKGALGAFAPPLDDVGNSVKGQLAARYLARTLGLGLFSSSPFVAARG